MNKNNTEKSTGNFAKKAPAVFATTLAALTLAACGNGNNNANAKSGSSEQTSTDKSSSENIADKAKDALGAGEVTNTPETLADFTATVKAAGYTIIPGTDNEGNQISGAAKESDGSYFVNVSVDNHDGSIDYHTSWAVNFSDINFSDGYSRLAPSINYVKKAINSND
jgi:hypothetical protein